MKLASSKQLSQLVAHFNGHKRVDHKLIARSKSFKIPQKKFPSSSPPYKNLLQRLAPRKVFRKHFKKSEDEQKQIEELAAILTPIICELSQ